MTHPVGLAYLFAGVVIGVGAYCLGRLVAVIPMGRRSHYGVNAAHVLMAVAMVGMLVPSWRVLPVGLWEAVFAFMAVCFVGMAARVLVRPGRAATSRRARRHIRHYLIHAAMAVAMLDMYRLASPVSVHGTMAVGMGAEGDGQLFTLVLVVVLLGSVIWQLDALGRVGSAAHVPVLTVATGPTGEPRRGAHAVLFTRHGAHPEMPTGHRTQTDRPWLAPRMEVGCHVAMCLVMAYVLVLAL